jgi:mannose-6-phosphate isomerase-like protein (cupin superfamily)/DNA-binding XRE family transcriptional regulator
MSMRELARRIEVSPSFLSQVERGRTNPSVGTLYAIVTELGVSLDELMSETPGTGVEELAAPPGTAGEVAPPGWEAAAAAPRRVGTPLQPSAGRRTIKLSGVSWERLTHDDDPLVDFLYVTYRPGSASCSDEDMMRHGGSEYGHVISGRLDVQIAFEKFELEPGDSIHFDSTVPHRLSNPYDEPCVAVWVVIGRRGDDRVFEPPGPGASHLPGLM